MHIRMTSSFLSLTVVALAVLFGEDSAQAGEPPKEPMLRLETGMHTAPIRRAGVDSAGRYAVTASEDKTVRVWNAATGEPLSVIRPPVGGTYDGRLNAVAISPDGNVVAAAGYTGYEWDGAVSIYIFDRASGRMTRKISGLPNTISHLAFSKDGQYLASTLGGPNGLRVFRTSDYSLAGEDKDYGDSSDWADFDANGRLVTVSSDGLIRLYDAKFRLISQVAGKSGKDPFSAAFSPDAEKVAVGYYDSTGVDVLSGRDLGFLYSPDMKGVDNGNLSSIAWSSDGQSLYAGGKWITNHTFPIRRWSNAGKGKYRDFTTSSDAIMQIISLPGKKMLVASSDPFWGVFDADGEKLFARTASIADFKNNYAGFRLSQDGLRVRFGYRLFGDSPAVFNATTRGFEPDLELPDLRAPVAEDTNLKVTDWLDTREPKLNGSHLALLERNEISRSLAIAPDRQSFILGTEWNIYRFDTSGKVKWKVPAPGET